ncbi:MAG: hypothetical protein Q4G35_09705 [Propionibacteriaceae bacterium]|nr:hypothetical protein [Propionibacteriaceae bacterium]
MLAGIIIAVVVCAGLAFALPWVTAQRPTDLEVEPDPTERFADSMRILRRDIEDYVEDENLASVSTPLTRRAELNELRLIARQAARRRLTVVLVLLATLLALTVLALFSILPWWSLAVPGGLLLAFLAVARFTVVAMHRSLDRRAQAVRSGFDEDEDTGVIDLSFATPEATEISIELTMPTTMGALWDPVPVTANSYMQQPLLPRTVRTIDLSAPVTPSSPLVPTADHPAAHVEDGEATITASPGEASNVAELRPRAVGE